ncbi:MAG: C69 family dipeptidase [Eubacteriales bacterium]|nr:C69 family dipeptidase [Eubacteriales bacterium]
MNRSSCTTVLVGKKASIDGSIMIARTEDYHGPINPKTFVVHAPEQGENRTFFSENTKLTYELPNQALRYTATPSDDPNEAGNYASASINEANVATSSTESLYGNEKVLAYDPLIPGGVAEDAINDVVAPYIRSAREGVIYLGEMIKKYGSAEGNGILFADCEEAWYMEIPTGHHWVAVRIPDDCYAVAPNHVCIEEIKFDDPANYLFSEGIQEFVEKYQLNPNPGSFNFRKIFGTYRELDRVYNTPRQWFAHKILDPSTDYDPTSGDIPFLGKAKRLISHEDVAAVLSSHYNETVYDPIGKLGTEAEKKRFRSISLSRTSQGHVLQMRPELPERLRGITWLSFGTSAFNPYIPYFSYIEDTPVQYKTVPQEVDLENAYWLAKLFGYYAEHHYADFHRETEEYRYAMMAYGRRRVSEIIEGAKGKSDEDLLQYLTLENQKTADYYISETQKKLKSYMKRALADSKLSFLMDKNL